MTPQISNTETSANQETLEKKLRIALPTGTEAGKALSFPHRSCVAVLGMITFLSLGMSSNLSAAEPAATSQVSLVTKQYPSSPELLASLRKASPANASAPLREVFESLGVPFPDGALVQLLPSGALMVRNTKKNIELFHAVIEGNIRKAGQAQ